MIEPSKEYIRKIQESGFNWYGEPLGVDGVYGPQTQWWDGILQLPQKRIDIVRTFIGYNHRKVKETPGQPNRGPWVDAFVKPGGIGLGHPWCIAFTSHVLNIDCKMDDWPYHMSAYKLIEWARKNNRLTDTPLPGDLHAFLYPDSTTHEGHGGGILGVNPDWVACCDGNVGDAVAVGRRARRGLFFIETVPAIAMPTMPTVLELKMLDGTRALTR